MPEREASGAGRVGAARTESGTRGFWFARLFQWLKLPYWLGAVLFAAGAYGGFTLLDWLAVGALTTYDNVNRFLHLVFFQLTAIFLGREMERILDYAESLGAGSTERVRTTLYSTRWAFLVALPIEAVYLGSVLLAPGFAPADLFRHSVLLGVFHILVGASGIWAFAYSMRSLNDLGRAPLSLVPYTEERSLGLRPFGSGALRLVAIYELAILAAVTPLILLSDYTLTGAPTFAVLGLLGLVLFFLPLLSFRRRMREVKTAELRWIVPRYAELVKAVRESGAPFVDDRVAGSLSALEMIRRDVHEIPEWPFDVGIVARLASVTFLPLMISVAARALAILILNV